MVLDPQSKPIAGATVTILRWSSPSDPTPPPPLHRVCTDAAGRFQFVESPLGTTTDAAHHAQPGLAPAVSVTVVAAGYAIATRKATLEDRDLQFVLGPETVLPVRVVDEQGRPVRGVHLELVAAMWVTGETVAGRERISVNHDVSELMCQPSNRQGIAMTRNLPRHGQCSFTMRDEQWAPTPRIVNDARMIELADAAVSTEVRIVVQPAASLQGQVVTEEGVPVAGIALSLQGMQRHMTGFAISTDERGSFRMNGLTPGPYHVQTWTPRAGPRTPPKDSGWVHIDLDRIELVRGEQRKDTRLMLLRGALIKGRIVEVDSSTPVEGAEVTAFLDGSDSGRDSATSGPDGTFRLRVRPSTVWLHIRPPEGFDASMPVAVNREATRFAVVNGSMHEVGDLQIHLRPLQKLRGRVLGPGALPVAEATVFISYGSLRAQRRIATRSGADGTFLFPTAMSLFGQTMVVRAFRGELSGEQRLQFGAEAEPVTIELRHRPLARVVGKVVDEKGAPLPGAEVDLARVFPGTDRSVIPTGPEGSYEIPDLWPGELYTVHAGLPGYVSASSSTFRATIGGVIRLPDLVVKAKTSFLDLFLVDEDDKPVIQAVVEVSPWQPDLEARVLNPIRHSDGSGRVRIEGLKPGFYRISATKLIGGKQKAASFTRVHTDVVGYRIVMRD